MKQKKSKLKKMITPHKLKELMVEANDARKKSYSPYSGFKVGAALLSADGKIFSGCNVENASYGGTICAERTAVLKAISEGAKTPFQAVHVVSSSKTPWPPCGMCLQVLAEFCVSTTLVTIAGQKGEAKMFQFSDLLPESFGIQFLK